MRWNKGVAGIVATGILLVFGLVLTGSGPQPIIVLSALVAVAAWVATGNTGAGYLTLFGPLVIVLAGRDAPPHVVTLFFMLIVGVGIALRSPQTRVIGYLVAGAALLGSATTALSVTWPPILGAWLVGTLVFLVVRTKVRLARVVNGTVTELDLSELGSPGAAVGDLLGSGFEIVSAYTVGNAEPAVTLVSPDRLTWVDTTWNRGSGVVALTSDCTQGSLRTCTKTILAPAPGRFVQHGSANAAEAWAWHRGLMDLARDRRWEVHHLNDDDVREALRNDYSSVDTGWVHALESVMRGLFRRWTGVRGPVDGTRPEAFDEWRRHEAMSRD